MQARENTPGAPGGSAVAGIYFCPISRTACLLAASSAFGVLETASVYLQGVVCDD